MRERRRTYKIRYPEKQEISTPVCPYCGQKAVIRPAEYVHGAQTIEPGTKLYVCSGYPVCDAYVGVHKGSKRPYGTLANSALRNKRIRTHRELNKLVQAGVMNKSEVYQWLAIQLNLPYSETHIGYFTEEMCDQAMERCRRVFRQHRERNKDVA